MTKPIKDKLITVTQSNEGLFVTWDKNASMSAKAVQEYGNAIASINMPVRSVAGMDYRSYRNIEPNLSVRSSYSRESYDQFRPGEIIGPDAKHIMWQCQKAYERIGIIRNIIDLMSDFTIQGIHLVHPNRKIEKVYRRWWEKINAKERSERFVSLLYRMGVVVVKRDMAKISISTRRDLASGALVSEEVKQIKENFGTKKYEVPWEYTFINPMSLEIEEGEASTFMGQYSYQIRLSPNLLAKLQKLSINLPSFISEAVRRNQTLINLPMDKINTFFYKKDDWQIWPKPILEAVLADIQLLEKMKLADLAALDGVISNVRIWKLGSLEYKIMPTPAAIAKLSQLLLNVGNGNTADLIWGPELTFEQHIPEVDKILGSEKYVSVMSAIYEGLGVPSTLTAKSDKTGFSNNFIGLKILIERLDYGRTILIKFWNEEIRKFQKAMGYKIPAMVRFSRSTLSDDVAEKALLIQLADRNLLSFDTVQELFGNDADIEAARMRFQKKEQSKGHLPPKAGPWHDPERPDKEEQRIREIFSQTGSYAPSQMGLELEPKKPGEKSPADVDKQNSGLSEQEKLGGQPNQGRPKNSKDNGKRKQKRPIVRTSAEELEASKMMFWANGVQDQVDSVVNDIYLKYIGKSNLRQLTKEEDKTLDKLKFGILCGFKPYETVTADIIINQFNSPLNINRGILNIYKQAQSELAKQTEITANHRRLLKALSYSIYYSNRERPDGIVPS